MQAREPLATDGPIMIATARIGIMRIVIVKATSTFILPMPPVAAASSEYCEAAGAVAQTIRVNPLNQRGSNFGVAYVSARGGRIRRQRRLQTLQTLPKG